MPDPAPRSPAVDDKLRSLEGEWTPMRILYTARAAKLEAIALALNLFPDILDVLETAEDFHREMVGAELDEQQAFHFRTLGDNLNRLKQKEEQYA